MNFKNWLLLSLICFCAKAYSQNLPSLLHGTNINATFSIVAYDPNEQEWGIAVATDNIYVGSSTIYIEPGVGAFSVIAETAPAYGLDGLQQLKDGTPIKEALEHIRKKDSEAHFRQVAGIDARGTTYAFTGESLKYWNGQAAHRFGKNYVVMGNQLADSVLQQMATSFENASGTLPERLLKSLLAGQKAGGQLGGKQSAALAVKGSNHEWFNQLDLRVDDSKTPFKDLQRLLNYHYGRIRTNQTLLALRMNNRKRAESLLVEAETLTKGWNGMSSKLALAHTLMGNDDKAVSILLNAITENPKRARMLPTFYCLREHPKLKAYLQEDTFSVKDWNNAITLLLQLNRIEEGITLAKRILQKYPEASYTHYLLGKGLSANNDMKNAKVSLEKAITIDAANREARLFLESLHE